MLVILSAYTFIRLTLELLPGKEQLLYKRTNCSREGKILKLLLKKSKFSKGLLNECTDVGIIY